MGMGLMDRNQGNTVLASLLCEAGWSPRALARRLNRLFGAGTVAETAPYHWRDAGGVPRPPLPALTAWALSKELGRDVTVAELWEGRAADSPLALPADAEMDVPWSKAGILGVIDDWVVSGLLDRRTFLAVSGNALTSIALSYPGIEGGRWSRALERGDGGSVLVSQIEQGIPLLQVLDDANGGSAHLAYVGAQFKAVALLLHHGGHLESTERRLLAALAELGHLAGWMAFDAGSHGLAQRYYLTALRAAQEASAHQLAAHTLADLGFQAASREQPREAIALGQRAADVACRTGSLAVQASVQSRLAYAYSVAGRLADSETIYCRAVDVLAKGGPGRDEPRWMYYLTPNHLDTQRGYGLAHAGLLAFRAHDRSTARALLRSGETLLRTGAHGRPLGDPSQRRALFEGAWLAVATAHRGRLEDACLLGRTALARMGAVQSARSTEVLRILADRLHRANRNAHVQDFLPVLDAALASRSRSRSSR